MATDTGTEDISNLSQENKKKKMEPGDSAMAVLSQALTHQFLEKITEPKNNSKNVCTWTSLAVVLVFTVVTSCCILVTLQSYGFLPKFSEEQNLKDRLTEKTTALDNCIAKVNTLNEQLQVQTLLPVVNEQFCAPMLQQNKDNRKDDKDELQRKIDELTECNNDNKKLRQEIDALKEDKLTLRGGLMEAEVKLRALVAQSEENGGKCEGWLCSGVKMLYDVVKDTVAEKKQSKQQSE